MNNGIDGNIRNVLFDTQFSAYPFATWAARLRVDPTPEINFQFGVFQTWPDIFDRDNNGLDWSIRIRRRRHDPRATRLDAGVLQAARSKADGTLRRQEERRRTADERLPGPLLGRRLLLAVGQLHPIQVAEKTGSSYGFYAHGDQMVYQEAPGSDQGLTVWAASGYYPQDNISIMPFQVNSGLIYKGLIPSRDDDREIVGVMYGRFSHDYASVLRNAGSGDPQYELVLEVAHRIQLSKFAYIQPDLQWVVRPGGTGRIPDALVLGAQMGVTF